jgi:hypothetical protein
VLEPQLEPVKALGPLIVVSGAIVGAQVSPKTLVRIYRKNNWKWPHGAGQAALHTILTLP